MSWAARVALHSDNHGDCPCAHQSGVRAHTKSPPPPPCSRNGASWTSPRTCTPACVMGQSGIARRCTAPPSTLPPPSHHQAPPAVEVRLREGVGVEKWRGAFAPKCAGAVTRPLTGCSIVTKASADAT